MKFRALGLASVAVAMYAVPAVAHHSFAMFDSGRSITLEGTIDEFQWTNPHSWILLTAENEDGVEEQWALELGSPGGLARAGWRPTTLTPGMRVTATFHPLRDGQPGGQFMAIVLPDGSMMGDLEAAASAEAGAGAPAAGGGN